jgi:hypothetical protein
MEIYDNTQLYCGLSDDNFDKKFNNNLIRYIFNNNSNILYKYNDKIIASYFVTINSYDNNLINLSINNETYDKILLINIYKCDSNIVKTIYSNLAIYKSHTISNLILNRNLKTKEFLIIEITFDLSNNEYKYLMKDISYDNYHKAKIKFNKGELFFK